MNIINNTEFPHLQFEKVGYFGELFSVIVVSQTCNLLNEQSACPISQVHRPPVLADSWLGEPEMSSLKTATDLVCRKKRSDILLSGHAWNASGVAREWHAEFQVGTLSRTLSVCGSREWQYSDNEWRISQPAFTDNVPLHYELASPGEFNRSGDACRNMRIRGGYFPHLSYHFLPDRFAEAGHQEFVTPKVLLLNGKSTPVLIIQMSSILTS